MIGSLSTLFILSLLPFATVSLTSLSAQTASKGKSLTACTLLTSAEVARLTGRSALANGRQISGTGDEPGSTNCGYMGSSLSVDLQPLQSIESFTAAAQPRVTAREFQPYGGLGDAAWFRYNKYLEQHDSSSAQAATLS
jgi:hypothetical protein